MENLEQVNISMKEYRLLYRIKLFAELSLPYDIRPIDDDGLREYIKEYNNNYDYKNKNK
tara:strand:- start:6220 stop:6396 length:177 start_codon:yes stop_codon:yes gene_type:complete